MMMTTSKGKTFDVDWMGEALWPNEMTLQYKDERPIVEIAEDFHNVEKFTYEDALGRLIDADGYTNLVSIGQLHNVSPRTLQITVGRTGE